jgi:hypothetical protein
VALKALSEQLKTIDDEVCVRFEFDGNLLTVHCDAKIYPMQAAGSSWPQQYSVRAGALKSLPKRLMSWRIQFSVWNEVLTIGNRGYRLAQGSDVGISPSTGQVPSRLTATDVLSQVQVLRTRSAQWDEILSKLNPTNDPAVQELLLEIRGPNLFVPHVGLGVIEHGCEEVLALSPRADSLAALREAVRRQNPFVRD